MGCFENGVASDVIDVAAGRDANPAHLRGECVTQVIAIQIQCGDDIEILRPRQHLLERDVGNRVLDHNSSARFAHGNPAPRSAIKFFCAEIFLRDIKTPVAECAFRKFHDVALVHERHAPAAILDRIGNRAVNQAHTAGVTDRFNADSHANFVALRRADHLPKAARFVFCPEPNFVELLWKFFLQKIENLLRLRRAGGVLDSGVNVFGVFAKDHHVHFLRMLDWRWHAFEVLHRPEAHKKIKQLSQRDIERANAAAHGSSQGSFDSHQILAESFDCVVRQPFIKFVLCCLTSENFEPRDLLFSAVCFFDCGIEHAHTRRPDVRPRAIAADERNDRSIGHIQSVGPGNFFARGRSNIFVRHKGQL